MRVRTVKKWIELELTNMGMHQKQWADIKTWRIYRYILWTWSAGPKGAIFEPFDQCLDGALRILETYLFGKRSCPHLLIVPLTQLKSQNELENATAITR